MEAAASEDLLEQKVHELDARLRQMKEERDQVSFNFTNFLFHEFQGKIIILYEIYFTNFYLFLGWTKMHLRHRTYV